MSLYQRLIESVFMAAPKVKTKLFGICSKENRFGLDVGALQERLRSKRTCDS
jgi:hypothetical protein